jgi:DNA-directed RNA polymerase sigma subunit (sigma70/sigma32)
MDTLYERPEVRQELRAFDAETLEAFASVLSPREAVVLHTRIVGVPPRRWESLARTLGISRDMVRQIEATVIAKFDTWKQTR